MRLYIVRHADPDYERDTITEPGQLEARALAPRLRDEGITRLYCSPLGRARATAAPTAELLGRAAEVLEFTHEHSGLWITQPPRGRDVAWDMHGETIHQSFPPGAGPWYASPPFAAPEYEHMYTELVAASDGFLAAHGYERDGALYRVVTPNRERLCVVCHGGFGLTWLAHLLALPVPLVWSGFWLPPTSVTTVLFDERSPNFAVPRCLGVGDVSHLYHAGLPRLPRGIKANYD